MQGNKAVLQGHLCGPLGRVGPWLLVLWSSGENSRHWKSPHKPTTCTYHGNTSLAAGSTQQPHHCSPFTFLHVKSIYTSLGFTPWRQIWNEGHFACTPAFWGTRGATERCCLSATAHGAFRTDCRSVMTRWEDLLYLMEWRSTERRSKLRYLCRWNNALSARLPWLLIDLLGFK